LSARHAHPKSQKHNTPTRRSVPPSSALGQNNRASSYIALTPEALQQHDFHQASSYRDVDVGYNQVDQGKRFMTSLDSVGIHLDPALHTKLGEPINMAPMDRFQASDTHSPYFDAYQYQTHHMKEYSATQTHCQNSTYVTSSIIANAGSEDVTYYEDNSAKPEVFVPERQLNSSEPLYMQDVEDSGYDLVGAGTQFDSYPRVDQTTALYINGDILFDEQLSQRFF
jgi:hypothetical protein